MCDISVAFRQKSEVTAFFSQSVVLSIGSVREACDDDDECGVLKCVCVCVRVHAATVFNRQEERAPVYDMWSLCRNVAHHLDGFESCAGWALFLRV